LSRKNSRRGRARWAIGRKKPLGVQALHSSTDHASNEARPADQEGQDHTRVKEAGEARRPAHRSGATGESIQSEFSVVREESAPLIPAI